MTQNTVTVLTGKKAIDALLEQRHWGNQLGQAFIISYSIPLKDAYWADNYSSDNEPATWMSLTANQAAYFRQALAAWQEVANIGFYEVPDSKGYGEIRVAFTDALAGDSTSGWAYAPGNTPAAGDIWLNPIAQDESFQVGSANFATLLHEMGHAIGLDHPFESSSNNSAVLTGVENSTRYTLMSYTDHTGAGNMPDGAGYYINVQPTTPMLYDIQAIQYLYGKNRAVRTGNDIYRVSTTIGELKTIWDAGGVDSLDLSEQIYPQQINLNDGQFSSLGVKQQYGKITGAAQDNVAIAYGVQIENAIGGSANDSLIGNALNNALKGGLGNDTLSGGAGVDIAIYQGYKTQYQISTVGSGYQVTDTVANRDGVDSLQDMERLQFIDTTLAFDTTGNAGQSYRLYQAAFNRKPDIGGLGYWIHQVDLGISLTNVATSFINSAEAKTLYGTTTNAATLINAFYNNVLHRTPDQSGYDFWLPKINSSAQAAAEVLIGFSESAENQLQVIGSIQNGIEFSTVL